MTINKAEEGLILSSLLLQNICTRLMILKLGFPL